MFKEILLSSSKPLKKAAGEKAQVMYLSFNLKDSKNPSRQTLFLSFFLLQKEYAYFITFSS